MEETISVLDRFRQNMKTFTIFSIEVFYKVLAGRTHMISNTTVFSFSVVFVSFFK